MLLKLESFMYALSLDLNMRYYHIKLYHITKKTLTIILLLGKCQYQKLPMGVCNSPNIFQENIFKLFKGFDMIRAYIQNLLVITKHEFIYHPKSLEIV